MMSVGVLTFLMKVIGALGIDCRVVVDRSAEIWKHPLVNAILPVVALPVRNPGAGHGGMEAVSLGHRSHRHIAAVAPPGDANAVSIHRQRLHYFIHACENVSQVSVAKI